MTLGRVLPMALLGLLLACDGEQAEPPSEARIILLAVSDPVLTTGAVEPATVLWLTTRSGRAWVSTPDGRHLGDDRVVDGGAVISSHIWPSDLEPRDNPLEVHVAPDSGEDPLSASLLITVAADCTRGAHCAGAECVNFACQ